MITLRPNWRRSSPKSQVFWIDHPRIILVWLFVCNSSYLFCAVLSNTCIDIVSSSFSEHIEG